MKIGIVIGRIGGIDGVALETEKWLDVLERMGHEVRVLAGALEGPVRHVDVLPELAFDHPAAVRHQQQAFLGAPVAGEAALLAELDEGAHSIADAIEAWVRTEQIELIVSENASAIPLHLTMGMAIRRVLERAPALRAITHDHDFAWERGDRYLSPFEGVRQILSTCFPVDLPTVRHAVINSAARAALAERFGITDAVVVPNVMDFDAPLGQLDTINRGLRKDLGLGADDRLLFQVTRIVRRKGIDIAIDLVHRLADPGVKLVVTGTAVDEQHDAYLKELMDQVARLGLEGQVLFAGDRFDAARRTADSGEQVYSLWDAYANAQACTYFSLYEGFGNAFVEAVVARVPIFVNRYEPVYWPDIGSKGFKTVMIEQGLLTDQAVNEVRQVLDDTDMRQEMTAHNFELGREHFSYQSLERLLRELVE